MRVGVALALLAAAGTALLWRTPPRHEPSRVVAAPAPPGAPALLRVVAAGLVAPPPPPPAAPAVATDGPYRPSLRDDPAAAAAIWRQVRVLGMEPREIAKLQERQQREQQDPERLATAERRRSEAKWRRQHPGSGSRQ